MTQSGISSSATVAILTDSGAIPSLYVRLVDPMPLITSNYNVVHTSPDLADVVAASADIVILQRWFGTAVLRAAERAQRRGVPIIYETDDHLLELPAESTTRFSAELLHNIRAGIAMADLVTCSTDRLAEELRAINANVVVNRNYGLSKPSVSLAGDPHAAIINTDYFKLADKAPFFRALAIAIVEHRYRISFFGIIDAAATELHAAYPEQVDLIPGFTDGRSEFLDQVAASGANVGLVPLTRSRDHSFKSDIKFLDYASIGIPAIFNNDDVYDDVRSGVDGLICTDNFDGYLNALAVLADEPTRIAMGAAASALVRQDRSIEAYAAKLEHWIGRLLHGEPGRSIAWPQGSASPSIDSPVTEGLMASEHGLYVVADGVRRHIASTHLVAPLIEAGVGYLDEERLPEEPLPFGPPLVDAEEIERLFCASGRAVARCTDERSLRISWIIPHLMVGGGGHRNIIRCAYQLERLGHRIGLYFVDTPDSSETIGNLVRQHFYPLAGHIGRFDDGKLQGDVVFATHWSTMKFAESVADNFDQIMYFVQDFEPSFYPLGSEYVLAENTYRKGYYAITSGVWCERFLRDQYGADADHFRFPVDTSIYYDRGLARQERVVFFAKPEMMRRCYEVGVEALRLFHEMRPDVEIAFFGSKHAADYDVPFPVTQLGVLPTTDDLAALYASSSVGMVFSTTNPSLVPYEMMACGLPVVDLDRTGNDANYDSRRDIACLAGPEAASLARSIAALLANSQDWAARRARGLAFAAGFPSEEEVGILIERLIVDRLAATSRAQSSVQGASA